MPQIEDMVIIPTAIAPELVRVQRRLVTPWLTSPPVKWYMVLYRPYPGTRGYIPGIENKVEGLWVLRANISAKNDTRIDAIK